MNKNVISRVVLSVLLIVFMYVAAACSVSNEKKDNKKGIDPTKDYQSANNAMKSAFKDEAMAFIRAAMEANVTSQIEDDKERTCFTAKELLENYIDSSRKDDYKGIVKKISDDEWQIYLTNGKYTIDGKKTPIDKSDVTEGSKISQETC